MAYVVYEYLNLIDDKVYIGYSKNIETRWYNEIRELEIGIQFNTCPTHPMLRAWKKYGRQNFEWFILDTFETKQEAIDSEIKLIAWFKELELAYNITDGGEGNNGMLGKKHSKETIEKCRIASTGKIQTAETIEKRKPKLFGNKSRTGLLHTEETKLKMSESAKGKPKSDEHRHKLSLARIGVSPANKGKRNKNSSIYTAFGENKTVVEWSRDPRCVVCISTLGARFRHGWDVEKALTTPSTRKAKQNV